MTGILVLERTIIHYQSILVETEVNTNHRRRKTLEDHVYLNGSAKQSANYQTKTDYIINHITKTFEFGSDIAIALKHRKPYDIDKHKPKLQSSKAKKDEDKEVETDSLK
jgi:hypothetical protein